MGDMNFNSLEGLEFFEDKHYYKYNNKYIPSVSSITKPISLSIYKDIDDDTLKIAAERGTAVHMAIEIANEAGVDIIEPEHEGYLDAYKAFRFEHKNLILKASEIRTADLSLWYAGTADEVYQDRDTGEYILADIKTSVNIEKAAVIPQLTAYKEALIRTQKIPIKKTYVLHLKFDGTYKWLEISTDLSVLLVCIKLRNHIEKYKNNY